ncbi:MAG TPA: hemerythrin family protein [Geobacteraceae bacterium]
MKIEWGDYLSVGMAEIDDQHKLLFDKFNALLAACDAGSGAAEVNRLFSFLSTYVVTHFSDEERLMRRIGFPDLPKHREMHQAFIRQVGALKARLNSEGPTRELVLSVSLTINGWLIEHISRMDRAIGRFAKEKK